MASPAGRTQGIHAADGGFQAKDGAIAQWYERTFVQTSGAGTYTATVPVPAGATILDIRVKGIAVWNGTSASLEVGDDDDPDGFFTAVDLAATDLLLNEELSFDGNMGTAEVGLYLVAASGLRNTYRATAKTITISVVQVGTGTLGRTRVLVCILNPSNVTKAAVKV